MSENQWTTVDHYISGLLGLDDDALQQAVGASDEAGLPSIQVSPPLGKLLQVLCLALRARHVLEIGTLGAYSTIWLARALPDDGRVVSLELKEKHAAVARDNIARAGLNDRVDIRVGPALQSLEHMHAAGKGPFDLVFIDADKEGTPEYFEYAVKLSRPGTVIIVDNVVRHGDLADSDTDDPRVVGMRRFVEKMAAEPKVSGTVIQTVGVKGYDGFALAVVMEK